MRRTWNRKLLLTVAALAAAALSIVFAHTLRSVTVRAYFGAEQSLIAHWPERWGKSAAEQFFIHKLTPQLCRFGVLGPARVQVEPGISYLLDPSDLIAVSILRGGEWQPEIWDAILPALSEGAVFFDVGAHIGYFSLKASAKVGSTGRILAFEPNPEILKLLRENIAANKAGNVLVEPIACTDREQTLTLWASARFNTGMSSLARERRHLV